MDWAKVLTIVGSNMVLQKSIYENMKDFHGRLCAIEERNKK